MNCNGQMTTAQRISVLEKAFAMARREVSIAQLAVLATSTIDDWDERARIRARLLALKTIIENTAEEIDLLHEEQAEERDAQGLR